MGRQQIIEAKRNLYHIILCMPTEELTKREVELGFRLAQDKDIQDILNKAFLKESNRP